VNWSYVIVHHTGAEERDAEQVRRYHLSLGWRDIGYNFVIERDGRVALGRSLDLPGAHCRADGMNSKGIGVAVIGNLESHPPLPGQSASLLELLADLCRRFGIQPDRVLGHREVRGAATDCPGRYLDMEGVRRELAERLASGGKGASPPPPSQGGGMPTQLAQPPSGLWRVQAGAFASKEKAEALAERLRAAGFEAWVVPPAGL
jgi:hypothetical protein